MAGSFYAKIDGLLCRAFSSWLLEEMERIVLSLSDESIPIGPTVAVCVNPDKSGFLLDPTVRFHFFTSRLPCGDCAILETSSSLELTIPTESVEESKPVEDCLTHALHGQVRNNRTGAKPLRSGDRCGTSDNPSIISRLPGQSDVEDGPQCVGVIRRKPGRGEATLSMSCSDKLARWGMLGFQGGDLTKLMDAPVYMDTIVVALAANENVEDALAALKRGLMTRCKDVANRLEAPYRWARFKRLFCSAYSYFHLGNVLDLGCQGILAIASSVANGPQIRIVCCQQ